jgi:hypothetical protein
MLSSRPGDRGGDVGGFWFCAVAAGASVTAAVSGQWGAPNVSLTITGDRGVLERSCGRTTIESIRPKGDGRVVARAWIESYGPGPQPADTPPGAAEGQVTGLLDGDTLTLTITSPGAPAERLHLERGRRSKIIRCL